jgi:hypothetical protein
MAVKGVPIALRTRLGSKDPDVHADPDDAQMPYSFNLRSIASPSTYSKLIFVVFGRRYSVLPLILTSGQHFRRFLSSLSLSLLR